MRFTSNLFILFFMPALLLGYYIIRKKNHPKMANLFLLLGSFAFVAGSGVSSLAILGGSILFHFALGKGIAKTTSSRLRKTLLFLGIFADLAILYVVKYLPGAVETINSTFGRNLFVPHIVIPAGISYYTFSLIAYLVDCYRMRTCENNLLEFSLFASWFPKFTQGPITYHRDFSKELTKATKVEAAGHEMDDFAYGLKRFAQGLVKKTVLADSFSYIVIAGFGSAADLSTLEAWLISLSFTFQIYFDFSGYCDMAIGISRMLGIRLPENFDLPYKAESIRDFWKRWHKTLTSFLREYLYFPLGGNRKGTVRTYLNLLLVFLVSGMWHGEGLHYVVWGLCHGVMQCIERALSGILVFRGKLWKGVRVCVTFLLVNAAWVMFRANTVAEGVEIWARMFTLHIGGVRQSILDGMNMAEWNLLAEIFPILSTPIGKVAQIITMLLIALSFCLLEKPHKELADGNCKFTKVDMWMTAVLLVWGFLSIRGISVFVYEGF